MRRRDFITLAAGAAAWPLATQAQQQERVRRIGVLLQAAKNDPVTEIRIKAFLQGLEQLGWTEGRNLQLEYRWEGSSSDIRKIATDLVALAPDVIVAAGSAAVSALQQS